MLWLLGWFSLAMAASPGGFHVDTARPVNSWSVRNVVIVNPDDEIIDQFTPRATWYSGVHAFEAEISGLVQVGPVGDLYGGVGAIRAGYWMVTPTKETSFVRRFGVTAWVSPWPRRWMPTAFGSSIYDTLSNAGIQLGWRMSWNEDAPWEVALHTGLASSLPNDTSMVSQLGLVKVIPLSGKTSLVLEQEFIYPDYATATLRPMVRFDLSKSTIDVGLQLPWLERDLGGLSLKPVSAQVLTRYQGRF
jgi:hypothetical protein